MDTGFRWHDKHGGGTAGVPMISWTQLNEGEAQWDRLRG